MPRSLKQLRADAHAALDPLWESGACTRNTAYKILAAVMRLPLEKAHISLFTKQQCRKVIAALKGRSPAEFARLLRNAHPPTLKRVEP